MTAGILQAGTVKGRVLSAEDESALVGATVVVYEDSVKTSEVRTDNRGAFSVPIVDGGKEYRLEIIQEGYDTRNMSLTNPWGEVDLGKILLTPEATMLREVEVTTESKVIYLPDKRLIFPNQLEKDRSTNPLNLLAQISYSDPALDINEFNKSISVNGQAPQILINGVRKKYADFNAIDPKNVLKIEYVTHPDVRFGAPYINIITVKPPQGGNVLAEVSSPVTTIQENHQGHFSYRRGKHEVAVNYNGTFRDSRKQYTDQTELYFAPDKTYQLGIRGLPSRFIDRDHSASVEYSITENPRKMFVATAQISYHSYHRNDRQDCENLTETFRRVTDSRYKGLSPSLQLYGSLPVSDDGRLEISVSGAYNSGDYHQRLSQSNDYGFRKFTDSEAWTVGGDIYYEHKFSWSRFNIGLSQSFNKASNRYEIDGQHTPDRLHSATTHVSAALSGQLGRVLSYYASAGVSHYQVDRGFTSPQLNLTLQKDVKNVHLQYQANYQSSSRSLSQYSEVLLPVNELLYSSGNMSLKNTHGGGNNISATYRYRKFSAQLAASYYSWRNANITMWEYVDNPASPIYGKFLQTFENDGSRSDIFGTALVMRLSNLFDHLSLAGQVFYRDAVSKWSGYEWKKRWFEVAGSAAAYFGNWQFGAYATLLPSYSLTGNFLWRNSTGWGIYGSWNKGNWSVRCDMTDLFSKKAFYQEKTTMAIGGLTESSSWIADKNSWIALTVRYQMSYGQGSNHKAQRNVSGNTRVDTGVSN